MDDRNIIQFRPPPKPLPQEIELDDVFLEWFSVYEAIILTDYIREDCRDIDAFDLICLIAPEVVLTLVLEM